MTGEDSEDGSPAGFSSEPARKSANCEETVHRLYHYLDGELTESRREAIASHLDGCGDCFEALGFEAELRKIVADRCKDRVPDHLRARIAEALHHEGQAAGGQSS